MDPKVLRADSEDSGLTELMPQDNPSLIVIHSGIVGCLMSSLQAMSDGRQQ